MTPPGRHSERGLGNWRRDSRPTLPDGTGARGPVPARAGLSKPGHPMQLPDSIILDIIRGARGAAELAGDSGAESTCAAPVEESVTPERRRARRAGVGSSIPFTRYGAIGAVARDAGFRDISAGGIGMLLGESILAPGEQVIVHPRRAWHDEAGCGVGPAEGGARPRPATPSGGPGQALRGGTPSRLSAPWRS